MPLSAGKRLGPYEIVAPVGAGGMGEVFRAHDTRLNRNVAIKVLPDHLAQDPQALARFHREAMAVVAVVHPIPASPRAVYVTLHGFGTTAPTFFHLGLGNHPLRI